MTDQEADTMFAGYLERYEDGLDGVRGRGSHALHQDVLAAQAAGLTAILLDRANARRNVDVPRVRSLRDLSFS